MVLFFSALVVGLSDDILTTEAGETWINVTGPENGTWFTQPFVKVSGSAGGSSHQLTYTIAELGTGEVKDVVFTDGNVSFTSRMRFQDDFRGSSLDTSKWVVLDDSGYMDVSGGTLTLGSSGTTDYPLIRTNTTNFPFPNDVDWTVTMYFRFSWLSADATGHGAGVTSGPIDPLESHMAVWAMDGRSAVEVLMDGTQVWTSTSGPHNWYKYELVHNPAYSTYIVYVDNENQGSFNNITDCEFIWLGQAERDSDPANAPMTVEYVYVFQDSGYWTSAVQDMGGSVVVDELFPNYTSTTGGGRAYIHAQVSDDNVTWSDWVNMDLSGSPMDHLEGRYLRYRAYLKTPGSRPGVFNDVILSSIDLRYHHSIASVEYDLNGDGWTTIGPFENWSVNLMLSEDLNHIILRATDSGGYWNSTDLFLGLDTTPPTGYVRINDGEPFTDTATVNLTIVAEDTYGIEAVQISTSSSMTWYDTQGYNRTVPWTFDDEDAFHSIFVRFVDTHGLVSITFTDGITLDTTPPAGNITIANDAEHWDTSNVVLTLDYWDANGVISVELSASDMFEDAIEVEIGSFKVDWDLGIVDQGTATVHMRLTDVIGHTFVANDSIQVYVPRAEGTVEIGSDTELTNTDLVTLFIFAPLNLGVTSMQISNDGVFTAVAWEPYAEDKDWYLSGVEGENFVFVRFKDFRGFPTLAINDSIVHDSTPPTVTVTVNDGTGYVTSTIVEMTLTYDDLHDPVALYISFKEDLTGSVPLDFVTSPAWKIPPEDGSHTIYVAVEDEAGNLGRASTTIIYATKVPILTVTRISEEYLNTSVIDIDVHVEDAYGEVEVQYVFDREFEEADEWMTVEELEEISIGGLADSGHLLYVRARNVAGLISNVEGIRFTLDRVPPVVTVEAPQDGDIVRVKEVRVRVEYRDDHGKHVMVRLDDDPWIVIDAYEGVTLAFEEWGDHTLHVKGVDEAWNEVVVSVDFTAKKKDTKESPGPLAMVALVTLIGVATLIKAFRTYKD